jgi:hypothetical protein
MLAHGGPSLRVGRRETSTFWISREFARQLVGSLNNYLFYAPSLGEFTQTRSKPRVKQFGLRFAF